MTSLYAIERLICLAVVSLILAPQTFADELNVYTYDAMLGKSSLGSVLKIAFEKKAGAKLNLVSFNTAGEALNQLLLEGNHTRADILMGIDSSFAERARATNLFTPISTIFFKQIDPVAVLSSDHMFLPFDYGYLAFIYNRKKIGRDFFQTDKLSLDKFMGLEVIKKKVVIEDPRTSSLGFSFFRWTQEVCSTAELFKKCWQTFLPKLVTISPGWTGAYGLFLQGEAELVLSYTTSRAYHIEREHTDEYEFINFEGGHALQVEAVGVLKKSKKVELINSFLSLLVSDEIQNEIPLTQWMYPAKKGIKLPASFKQISVPTAIQLGKEMTEIQRKKMLSDWAKWVGKAE